MKKQNEFEQLFAKFDKGESTPSNHFRYTLKAKVLEKYEDKSLIQKMVDSVIFGKYTPFLSITAVCAVFIVSFIWLAYFQTNQITIAGNTKEVSGELRKQVVNKFYLNNQNDDISFNLNSKGYSASDVEEIDMSLTFPSNNDLWKISTVNKRYINKNLSLCQPLSIYQSIESSISEVAILKSKNQFKTYSKIYDADGQVVSYYYTDNIDNEIISDNSVYIDFDIENDENQYKLTEIEKDGIKKYYITSYATISDCSLRIETEIDGETYKILETNYFLDNESKNLVMTVNYSYSESFNLIEDIESRFEN